MKVRKAIIPAAGLGTRFLPATKAQPKEMLPIVDKPSIQYIVEEAVASGIEEILIITGRNKVSIEDHFDMSYELETILEKKGKTDMLRQVQKISNMVNIQYVRQKEPNGLGQAIACAESFVANEPFAVLLGDDLVYSKTPCLKQLIEKYYKYGGSILGVQEVLPEDVSKYGIVSGKKISNDMHRVIDLVEKPSMEEASTNIAILGRYIINPEIFDIIRSTKPGAGDEIQLTDALKELAKNENMYAYTFEGIRYDVGSKLGFLKANVEFALRRNELKDDFMEYLNKIRG